MRKLISLFAVFCLTITSTYAETLNKTIRSLKINDGAISVSVKDTKSGGQVFQHNKNVPMNPASTLKMVTLPASINTLGKDYKFETTLYKSVNNDLYLKLGADPLLTYRDVRGLIDTAKEKNIIEPKNFYIDSSIFDNNEWGEGWQWDDDLNPFMPKFSAYNIDGNLLNVKIIPASNILAPKIEIKPYYPMTFMNYIKIDYTSKQNIINFERNKTIAPNIIDLSGTVSSSSVRNIPTPNPRRYFILRLEDAIKNSKIRYYKPIKNAVLPNQKIYKVESVSHEIVDAVSNILKNSNNMTAETVFKLAGGVYANSAGSAQNSINMLNDYLDSKNINHENIKIVDGSGVSKNNLVTADFMTDYLVKLYGDDNYEFINDNMASAGEGTLQNRMLYFKDNLKAKTGTLSNTSAICGYLKTRKGKLYAFDIMINDPKSSDFEKKNAEEQILRTIYANY